MVDGSMHRWTNQGRLPTASVLCSQMLVPFDMPPGREQKHCLRQEQRSFGYLETLESAVAVPDARVQSPGCLAGKRSDHRSEILNDAHAAGTFVCSGADRCLPCRAICAMCEPLPFSAVVQATIRP
ncbi:hypothetical protein [Ideonella sp. A 288]|uniref:hypothetical protein n=1 Tax=Ideonella sp. A 288 TaxID=1962181 RepID=UPI00130303C9|nr:hypothetical protein [Ideonella sp. A 288]